MLIVSVVNVKSAIRQKLAGLLEQDQNKRTCVDDQQRRWLWNRSLLVLALLACFSREVCCCKHAVREREQPPLCFVRFEKWNKQRPGFARTPLLNRRGFWHCLRQAKRLIIARRAKVHTTEQQRARTKSVPCEATST
ncbi:hypothetical protein CAOG_009627 [Capsaspora owczarzaki ATCC 30864]|uniref:Uncharacterized protein n=1 Tax=Capsaspora owczarzaki (strain ATCC 30864) TaxID=595528 RepID=A0A0D2X270_CAPO3|nr:hypothetical protein CAOG_009627 [Capsaspora owczarzaki ATCC 30864]